MQDWLRIIAEDMDAMGELAVTVHQYKAGLQPHHDHTSNHALRHNRNLRSNKAASHSGTDVGKNKDFPRAGLLTDQMGFLRRDLA